MEEITNIPVSKYDEFTRLQCIGEGGFGTVYKAEHVDWGTIVLKILPGQFMKEKERKMFVKEANIHFKLNHPNIVKLLGLVSENEHHALVLEYMEHGDMSDYLHGKKLNWKEKLPLVFDVSVAMTYLHSLKPAVIHGDLKIANVLIGNDSKAKVCDFGFSEIKSFSISLSKENVQQGTGSHIPPENLNGNCNKKSEKFDVYAFGIFMWEVMTEEKPFAGEKDLISTKVPNGHRPDKTLIPDDVTPKSIKLMEKCWHQNSEERPSFIEIKEQLGEDKSSSFSSMKRTTKSTDKKIQGLTCHDDIIYILCLESNVINSFPDIGEAITIQDMKDPRDLVSADNCLYISDFSDNSCIWIITLPNKEIKKKVLKGKPYTLSVSFSDNLLVLLEKKKSWFLEIYKPCHLVCDGKRKRGNKPLSIPLPADIDPRHAVQTSEGSFLILSQVKKDKSYWVREISPAGVLLFDFNFSDNHLYSLKNPIYMAIDEKDRLYVVDYEKNRIFRFDFNNNDAVADIILNCPRRLHYSKRYSKFITGGDVDYSIFSFQTG